MRSPFCGCGNYGLKVCAYDTGGYCDWPASRALWFWEI